jgi:predicted RNA-binding protein YlxR (DUF448 family)
MQKVKKIPQRQCVGCREMKDKRALIRAVKSPQGEVSLDFTGKKPGRGAYVCPNSECLKRARKSRSSARWTRPSPRASTKKWKRRWQTVDKLLNLIGLAKKAGKLEVGEEPVGAAARSKHARLILIASDAADNTRRRALHFGEAGECICLEIPPTKEDLGRALGRTSCALLALTDIGFAEAVAKKLAESDEAHYGEAAKRLTIKAARAAERRKELKQHEKNVRTGKKKPHQEEPQPAPAAKAKSAEKSESKRPRGAVKHGRTRAEREKAHRAAEKQRAARRFAHSRPVKKGKGSIKKDSKQRSQHTEVQ